MTERFQDLPRTNVLAYLASSVAKKKVQRYGHLVEQSPRKMPFVVFFERVLFLKEAEKDHGLVQNVFNLGVG